MKISVFQVCISFSVNQVNNLYLIANDEEGEGAAGGDSDAVTVIDLVDAHRLKEIEFDKKAWTAYIKGK